MTDDGVDPETIFTMDPEATVWILTRQLVDGLRTLAELGRKARDTAGSAPESVVGQELLASFERLEHQWYRETLPTLAASLGLAAEVFDTFGPGLAEVADPMEAAIWNNKFFVWFNELSGRPGGT